MESLAYIPGSQSQKYRPLERFLPIIPVGVISEVLKKHFQGNKPLILDPFGSTPDCPFEIAQAGFSVIVTINNPIIRFLLEMRCSPINNSELQAGLAELGATTKGKERLENHILSLYYTECPRCREVVSAEGYIWDRDNKTITGKIIQCKCGENGEFPADDKDRDIIKKLTASAGLHRSRMVERVVGPNDPDRIFVEETLNCYLPRALYAIDTILNRVDGISLSRDRRRGLDALLLSAFDDATSLWAHPPDRPRPKLPAPPPRFVEKNIWRSLENNLPLLAEENNPVPLREWASNDSLPVSGGGKDNEGVVYLFDGPMRDLAKVLKNEQPGGVVTVIPRPNQAFWSLSVIWAGWLWGQKSPAQFKAVLRRHRHDWSWHAAALNATFNNLIGLISLNSPMFTLVPEIDPAFMSSVFLAAISAGFELSGLALRSRHDPVHGFWHKKAFSHGVERKMEINPKQVHSAILDFLQERSESTPYLFLHSSGLINLASTQSIYWRPEALAQINNSIQDAINKPEFIHYSESINPESGLWSIKNYFDNNAPLIDRVEVELLKFLQSHQLTSQEEVETFIYSTFTGLQTPSRGLISALVTSYMIDNNGKLNLRDEDKTSNRIEWIQQIARSVEKIVTRLNLGKFVEINKNTFITMDSNNRPAHVFNILGTTVVGNLLRENPYPPETCILIIPDARGELLAYKANRDPDIKNLLEKWSILKSRNVIQFEESENLTIEIFREGLLENQIEKPDQLRLL